MKAFGNKRNESSSKKKSEKNQNKEENQSVVDMEIIEVPATDGANVMSAENGTTANVGAFIVRDYHQVDLLVRIGRIEYPDIRLRDVNLSHLTSLRTLICMYGSDYRRSRLTVTFHSGLSADDVTTLSTGGMTVGRQVLNNCANVFLIDERHGLEEMRQLHLEGDVG